MRGIHWENGRRFFMARQSRWRKTDAVSLLKHVRFNESFPTAIGSTLAWTCIHIQYSYHGVEIKALTISNMDQSMHSLPQVALKVNPTHTWDNRCSNMNSAATLSFPRTDVRCPSSVSLIPFTTWDFICAITIRMQENLLLKVTNKLNKVGIEN